MPIQRGVLVALTAVLGCDRGHHEAPAPVPAPAVAKQGCTLAPIPLQVKPGKRVVAIGDLHGDLGGARAALRAAQVIDATDRWIGGDTMVVQTGDVLDRGDDESKIFDLLGRVDADARAHGGTIVMLLGNHELMNAAHDFRYVTPAGMTDFGGDRAAALGAGGPVAAKLAHHNVVAIAGDTVFSHAGVLPGWASKLDEMNLAARCWLDGQTPEPPAALTSDDSPVWNRVYGIEGSVDCEALRGVLHTLGAKRMVVGHTVQKAGITSDCDGALWRIDVGLARIYGGPIQVLELGDPPKVLQAER